MKCELCKTDIFPEEVHYKLCVHMEVKDTKTDQMKILEIRPLETRCKACVESEAVTC